MSGLLWLASIIVVVFNFSWRSTLSKPLTLMRLKFDSEMLEIKWPHLLCIAQELYSCNLKAKNKNETLSFLNFGTCVVDVKAQIVCTFF